MSKSKRGSKENPITSNDREDILQDEKTFSILEAAIKDGFCSYKYEVISGNGLGDVHSVKGSGIVKDDMHTAFSKFNVHLAVIDDVFKHSRIEIKDIDQEHSNELTGLFTVTGFKIKGGADNESIILIGNKHVSSAGGFIELESPKIVLDNLSSYKWYNELKAAANDARREVELYKEGKYTPVEPEEAKPDPAQTKMSFEIGGGLEMEDVKDNDFEKFISYGGRAGIYSHSGGMKYIDKITYATIGSVAKKHHLFREVKNIIIDEAHLVGNDAGMYFDFIKAIDGAKVLGLTATPYRLHPQFGGAELKFLTRTNPRIFNKVLYYIQNDVLFDKGYLASLEYFSFKTIDRTRLEMNKSGTDFTEASIKAEYSNVRMPEKIIHYANRVLAKRKNILIFCSLISEAHTVSKGIPGSVVLTGETPAHKRDKIIQEFKKGIITKLVVVGMLTTGFDFAGLEAVLIGRSMMSMGLYYQIIGRVMRPYTYPDGTKKTGWVVDLGGNVEFFGKIETMRIEKDASGLFYISNKVNGGYRRLTNVTFSKN